MLGLLLVIGFIALNAAIAPALALLKGQSLRGWWNS